MSKLFPLFYTPTRNCLNSAFTNFFELLLYFFELSAVLESVISLTGTSFVSLTLAEIRSHLLCQENLWACCWWAEAHPTLTSSSLSPSVHRLPFTVYHLLRFIAYYFTVSEFDYAFCILCDFRFVCYQNNCFFLFFVKFNEKVHYLNTGFSV